MENIFKQIKIITESSLLKNLLLLLVALEILRALVNGKVIMMNGIIQAILQKVKSRLFKQ